jgi:hypothetical protein
MLKASLIVGGTGMLAQASRRLAALTDARAMSARCEAGWPGLPEL